MVRRPILVELVRFKIIGSIENFELLNRRMIEKNNFISIRELNTL
jgi:hypothetical protein